MSPSLSGDDVMRNAAKTSNEKLDNFDYLTNFDDDNETAKNKLYKVGQYEMQCVVATKTSSLLYHLALLISSFPIMLF
jgi:hypothetical protein